MEQSTTTKTYLDNLDKPISLLDNWTKLAWTNVFEQCGVNCIMVLSLGNWHVENQHRRKIWNPHP